MTITKLKEFLAELNSLTTAERRKYDRLAERIKAIALSQFADSQTYTKSIERIYVRLRTPATTFGNSHINSLAGVLELMIDELELANHKAKNNLGTLSSTPQETLSKNTIANDNSKIFIVHGHNEGMKFATARTLEKLGLTL